jgi:hypothetical protein
MFSLISAKEAVLSLINGIHIMICLRFPAILITQVSTHCLQPNVIEIYVTIA